MFWRAIIGQFDHRIEVGGATENGERGIAEITAEVEQAPADGGNQPEPVGAGDRDEHGFGHGPVLFRKFKEGIVCLNRRLWDGAAFADQN